jgi:hepatocyte growth factor-regulated tyrosine kinase substrate
MPLPHLGIVQPVRVCETCHEELNLAKTAKVSTVASPSSSAIPAQGNRSMQPRSARIEDDDDKDLKMALQMSLEEAKRSTAQPASTFSQPKPKTTTQSTVQERTDDAEDEDLKAAIAASLKDAEASKAMQYPSLQTYPQSQPTQPPPQQQPQIQPQAQQPLGQYQVFAL